MALKSSPDILVRTEFDKGGRMDIEALLGKGRTSYRRAPKAILLACLTATLLIPAALELGRYSAEALQLELRWPEVAAGAGLLLLYFMCAVLAAGLIGTPIWIALRRMNLERGWVYGLGGVLGGLLITGLVQGSIWDHWTLALVDVDSTVALVGGLCGLVFWINAREKPMRSKARSPTDAR